MVPNRSWSKRLKSIGHSSLGLKLKASRAYLKSFFTKSSCSDHKSCDAKAGKRKPFGQIQRERYNNSAAAALMRSIHGGKPNEEELGHRKSFSGIIRWNSTTKSSSCMLFLLLECEFKWILPAATDSEEERAAVLIRRWRARSKGQ